MRKSGVYRIDLGNGWFYVGSSQDLDKRESQHRRELLRGDHCNQIMQNTFNKHGEFAFMVLGRYQSDEIIAREQELLDRYCGDPKCANIALVAGVGMAGRKHSVDTKKNMSATRLGKKRKAFTPEWRANISAGQKGRKASLETRAKMSAAATGKTFSAETRAKISAAKTGKKASEETRAKLSAAHIERYARLRAAQTVKPG